MHATNHRIWIRKQHTKRLFLAIPVSSEWTQSLGVFVEYARLRKISGSVPTHWTLPVNFHITVRFIGYVNERCIPGLITMLRGLASDTDRFELPFASMETATPEEPKMIWARFLNTPAFDDLVKESTKRVSDFLYDKCHGQRLVNGHDVIPHITVARLKGEMKSTTVISYTRVPDSLPVNSFILYASETRPTGSVYQRAATFRLYTKEAL